jgi:geranylgeranyl diphosphate synthase type I
MSRSHPSPPQLNLDERLAKVEVAMQRYAHGGRIDRLGSMTMDHLSTGGRRFRARLALLACQALEVPEREAILWATAVELLHNATLIHDDIQDEDTTRRGSPTLWMKHGRAQAINAGDFLLMLPLLVVEDLRFPVNAELGFAIARAATRIVRGQCNEMGLRSSGRFDWENYSSSAQDKTGALLALPVFGALRLAGATAESSERISELFRDVGLLFQLQDDLVDLYGDKGRGEIGCDLYEGKISALVVAQLERSPRSRRLVLDILDRPRQLTTPEDVHLLSTLFERSGARDDVVSRICAVRARILSAEALVEVPGLWAITQRLISWTLEPVLHLLPRTGAEPCSEQRTAAGTTA